MFCQCERIAHDGGWPVNSFSWSVSCVCIRRMMLMPKLWTCYFYSSGNTRDQTDDGWWWYWGRIWVCEGTIGWGKEHSRTLQIEVWERHPEASCKDVIHVTIQDIPGFVVVAPWQICLPKMTKNATTPQQGANTPPGTPVLQVWYCMLLWLCI